MNCIIHDCAKKQIVDAIQAHRYLYHEMKLPVISDRDFDMILDTARRFLGNPQLLLRSEFTEDQKLQAQHLLQTIHAPAPCYG